MSTHTLGTPVSMCLKVTLFADSLMQGYHLHVNSFNCLRCEDGSDEPNKSVSLSSQKLQALGRQSINRRLYPDMLYLDGDESCVT